MIGHMEEVWNMVKVYYFKKKKKNSIIFYINKTRGEDNMSPSKILDFHYVYCRYTKF